MSKQAFCGLSAKLYLSDFKKVTKLLTASAISDGLTPVSSSSKITETDYDQLLNRLSFSHFIELLKAEARLIRTFYEVEALKNNWSVRELQRAMNKMLYETVVKKIFPVRSVKNRRFLHKLRIYFKFTFHPIRPLKESISFLFI